MRITEPITTARLLLRPYTEDDHDALLAIRSREDVTRYLYFGPQTPAQVRKTIERRITATVLESEGDSIILAIVTRDSGAFVGDINFNYVSEENSFGEIGFVINPDQRGRGYAGEAAAAMLALGFRDLGLHRIIGRCDARNKASARVMEKLGMRREAHFLENEFVKGEWSDELVYAILAREWEAAT